MDKVNKSKKLWYKNIWLWVAGVVAVLLLLAEWLMPGGLIQ